jgi:hypothetical protein
MEVIRFSIDFITPITARVSYDMMKTSLDELSKRFMYRGGTREPALAGWILRH